MAIDTLRTTLTPSWMRRWLVAAGAYNIVWGAAMVLTPIWTLRVLGCLLYTSPSPRD